ncbi:MAG: OmpA family protein [Marinoscillum sp.]|uniref:OmpA family protein n=1 Tax=Marinoscillum sp. TaxID=2024838 RepID=UPI0032FC227E
MRTIHQCGKLLLAACAGMIATIPATAQEAFYQPVEKLSPGVNSPAEEIMPMLASEGNKLYFVRTFSEKNVGGKAAGQDIWVSEKKEGEWDEAKNLKALNNGDNNSVVGLNESGNSLYLINNYSALYHRTERGIVSSTQNGDKWGRLNELPISIEIKNDYYGFYLTPDESTLIISMMGGDALGEEDLYVSEKTANGWSKPIHLGHVINSSGFEISPFLSADKRTLYFSSNGFQGLGDADVYQSERLGDGWTNWSAPKNLGAPINSEGFDAYFYQSKDGSVLFSSNRSGGLSDLYQTALVKHDAAKAPALVTTEEPISEAEIMTEPEPEVVSVLTEVNKKPLEGKEIVIPEALTIFFGFDSYDITAYSMEKIDAMVQTLKLNDQLIVKITGHTDAMGDDAYNLSLSEKRAKAVSNYLIRTHNIDEAKISALGVGKSVPQAPVQESKGNKWNRKAVVTFEIDQR